MSTCPVLCGSRAAPTPFNSLIHTHAGEITPQMVAWLSSIKEKNLNNCGKFVLTGDMSQLSITKVDLRSMNTLEGTLGSRSVVRDAPWGLIDQGACHQYQYRTRDVVSVKYC